MAGIIVITTLALGGAGFWYIDKPALDAKGDAERSRIHNMPIIDLVQTGYPSTLKGVLAGLVLSAFAVQISK
jgi:hypothetical protein